jgi:tetratricopeptide (TPR) repeat protein
MALAYANIGEWEEARRLLRENVRSARRQLNRVELAKAAANLGEIERRADNLEAALPHLEEAAKLEEDVGDFGSAAATWAILANTYALLDRGDDVYRTAAAADVAAGTEGSAEARAHAATARAYAHYLSRNYQAAAASFLDAVESQSGTSRLESYAHALESFARADEWKRYRPLLDRFLREALESPRVVSRGYLLTRPARFWLTSGHPQRAARTAAWALLLALQSASHGAAGEDQDLPAASVEELSKTFLAVAEALTTMDADPTDQVACRKAILRQVERLAPQILDFVVELLSTCESEFGNRAEYRSPHESS